MKLPVDDLVAANRVLAAHGILDGYGHVSVRHPEDPARYLLARGRAPEMVTAAYSVPNGSFLCHTRLMVGLTVARSVDRARR